MHIVLKEKKLMTESGRPTANMWCTKTTKPRIAIADIE